MQRGSKMHISLLFRLGTALVPLLAVTVFSQDTLKVNPDSVTLKFENDRVRVLETVLKPGVKDNEHSHPNYVTYVVSGGKFRVHTKGVPAIGQFKTGEVLFREAQTHWAENIGKTTIRLIMFELKDVNAAGEPYRVPADRDPVKLSPQYYKVPINNDYVRVLEYRLKAGQKEQVHSHPCGVVYYLTSAKWKATSSDGTTTESETIPYEILWRDPTTHGVENVGKTDARAIAIELKGPCLPTK